MAEKQQQQQQQDEREEKNKMEEKKQNKMEEEEKNKTETKEGQKKTKEQEHQNKKNDEKLMKDAYYKLDSPASLSSLTKLRNEIEKTTKSLSKKDILKFLQGQPVFTVFSKPKKKFPRRKILKKQVYSDITSDLIDMTLYSNYSCNKLMKWICLISDIFSNHISLYPLKQKSKVEMEKCMTLFLEKLPKRFTVNNLWADEGRYYYNNNNYNYYYYKNIEND